jgi:hypothetical protein
MRNGPYRLTAISPLVTENHLDRFLHSFRIQQSWQPVAAHATPTPIKSCGKTHSGGRPRIYPQHKANQMNVASAPAVCFCSFSPDTRPFSAACLTPARRFLRAFFHIRKFSISNLQINSPLRRAIEKLGSNCLIRRTRHDQQPLRLPLPQRLKDREPKAENAAHRQKHAKSTVFIPSS